MEKFDDFVASRPEHEPVIKAFSAPVEAELPAPENPEPAETPENLTEGLQTEEMLLENKQLENILYELNYQRTKMEKIDARLDNVDEQLKKITLILQRHDDIFKRNNLQ